MNLKRFFPAVFSLIKSLFAKEVIFDEIIICGDESFALEVQRALCLLRDKSPDAYRIVKENIANIFQCKSDANSLMGKWPDGLALDIADQSITWIAGKVYYQSKKTSILRLLHKDGRRPAKAEYSYQKVADEHYRILKEIGSEYEELEHLADWIESEFNNKKESL